ncbi:MAG: type VI secretion system baseplate subunit TssE [Bryobacterales bacterium]|nr:type VI secretion system baseplate subunit TssE [Bryobacterales bacterium]
MEPRNKLGKLALGPKPRPGLRVPLFDRLVDARPGEPPRAEPYRVLYPKDVVDSVRREVHRLLRTRVPVTWTPNLADLTVIDYGLPDYSAIDPANPDDCLAISAIVAARVAAFEPRLRNVRVRLEPDPEKRGTLTGILEADLWIDMVREPVSFPLIFDSTAGEARLGGAPGQQENECDSTKTSSGTTSTS